MNWIAVLRKENKKDEYSNDARNIIWTLLQEHIVLQHYQYSLAVITSPFVLCHGCQNNIIFTTILSNVSIVLIFFFCSKLIRFLLKNKQLCIWSGVSARISGPAGPEILVKNKKKSWFSQKSPCQYFGGNPRIQSPRTDAC